MQSSGYVVQSMLHPNLCRDIQPIGGVLASPLFKAATVGAVKGRPISAIQHDTTISQLKPHRNLTYINENNIIASGLTDGLVQCK